MSVKRILAIGMLIVPLVVFAAPIQLAITIDDLPAHASLPPQVTRLSVAERMLAALKKHSLTGVYGFVNGGSIQGKADNQAVLNAWVASGQLLGNHTFNHVDINTVDASTFIQQIKMNDQYRDYFRYPYLYEGNTQTKRDTVRQYLFSHHYQIAQVTTDFEDYLWNDAYVRCLATHDMHAIAWLKKSYIQEALKSVEVAHLQSLLLFHRDVKKILLLHIGVFDSLMLDSLLNALEKQQVSFITLPNALQDPIYQLNPNVVSDNSGTFLNQLQTARHIKPPPMVDNFIANIPEEKIGSLCVARTRSLRPGAVVGKVTSVQNT